MNTIKLNSGSTLMVAHRGLSGLETENTCAAFVAAGNRQSYFGIETDVHVTADGKYIVIHDDDTARVAGEAYCVEQTDYATLRALRLKNIPGEFARADYGLPSLEEYIQICKHYEKTAVLELKNRMEPADIAGIVEAIRGIGYLEKVIFISFALENLLELRKLVPAQPAQYLLEQFTPADLEVLRENKLDVDLDYTAVTPEVVAAVHGIGQKVNCWTCNTAAEGAALVAMGVDMITSNILEAL